jgi:hypothetical protein
MRDQSMHGNSWATPCSASDCWRSVAGDDAVNRLRRSPEPQPSSATLRDKTLQRCLIQALEPFHGRRHTVLVTFGRLPERLIQVRHQSLCRSEITAARSLTELRHRLLHVLRLRDKRLRDHRPSSETLTSRDP